ncbi:hypothetical protein DYB32_000598 [Aphanomyces invadans]|uniref:CAP-Gly domain-containing protein n=1 Tax=Aphanomyces invadans TaxID=157072 RepID=A0A3R7AFW6_9STRA|nr:hypothetical protein DYB32_000598 [Aphanomyces invadans]
MNKRVQDADGFRGSVRYEGPIQGKNASTVYWGVDWDDPSRGKHSGESGGVRYFEAAHPTSGSFVLPEKVSLGIGILEALHERYMQSEDLDSRAAGRVGTSSGSSKPIQLVGVRKIQYVEHIHHVRAIMCCGREKQDLGVIGKVSVEVNDLSFLVGSAFIVLKLSTELPQLEHLVLSGNILTYDVDVAAPLVTFPTVHVLVMHYTRTSWGDLLRICRDHFPALRELHAASNQLTDDALAAHDAATTTLGATTGPAALAKSLAKVTFVPMSMNATTMDTMVKALPLSMKVAQVKLLVEKKYGLLPTQHHLSFRASKKAMPMPLDDDNGELGYFGVQEGGELLINDLL